MLQKYFEMHLTKIINGTAAQTSFQDSQSYLTFYFRTGVLENRS